MKNIGNYRKYDIFFTFRFKENMIFPPNAENHEIMIFMFRIFKKMLFFMQCNVEKYLAAIFLLESALKWKLCQRKN